jgi:benzoate/toluate 1,2-dioxygenase reductase subunit
MVFQDGETVRVDCQSFETVVQAAARQGVRLLTDCREGGCGTCKAALHFGQYSLDDYSRDALPDAELAEGRVLTCRLRPESPCVVEFDYPLSAIRRGAARAARTTSIVEIAKRADDVIELTLEAQDGKPFTFLPGQYANLQIPDTHIVRSYSFVNEPGNNRASFLIRLLREGAMSNWLQSPPSGATMMVAAPFGRFFLRDPKRPLVFVAGGTGVGPIISMLDFLTTAGSMLPSVKLAFGVNSAAGLFYRERLERLVAGFPDSSLVLSIVSPGSGWDGVTGTAVDALDSLDVAPDAHAYLCGPQIMVERAQAALELLGLARRVIFAESFLPTSESKAA